MKQLCTILCLLTLSFYISAQDNKTIKEKRTVEKWIVSGDEVEELLKELSIENEIDTDFNDDDRIEIIRIEKNETGPHLPMFFMEGDHDFDLDFDFDLDDIDELKFKIEDNGDVEQFNWDGEGQMPIEIQNILKGLEDKIEFHHEDFDFEEGFDGDFKNLFEERPLLGVYTEKSDAGVIILEVIPQSGAEKAGLKEGDILLEINSQKINSTIDLIDVIQEHKTGDKINVTYKRDTKTNIKEAILGSSDNHQSRPIINKECKRKYKLKNGSDGDMRKPRLGVQFLKHTKGPITDLIVDKVIQGSTAEDAGIKPGDKIIELNNQKLANSLALIEALRAIDKGDQVNIKIIRDGQEKILTAPLKSEKQLDDRCRQTRKMMWHMDKTPDRSEDIFIIRKKGSKKSDKLASSNEKEVTIELYPNPTEGSIRIKFNGDEVPTEIKIHDAQGKEFYNEMLVPQDGRIDKIIELDGNPSGALFMTIKNGKEIINQKIILQK